MAKTNQEKKIEFGEIKTASELGKLMREYRKSQGLTLEKVSGLTSLGIRFLSELERGKETAELGKTLSILNRLGIAIILQPRSHLQSCSLKDKGIL